MDIEQRWTQTNEMDKDGHKRTEIDRDEQRWAQRNRDNRDRDRDEQR
jgi:hypothetical protein